LLVDKLTNASRPTASPLVILRRVPYVCVVTKAATPLDGAYCNALLIAHWSVRQQYYIGVLFYLSGVSFFQWVEIFFKPQNVCGSRVPSKPKSKT